MGPQSLRMMLRQSGLERFVTGPPAADDQAASFASELTRLQQSIRNYYGQGARGSLNRIGRAAWRSLIAEAPLGAKINLMLNRLRGNPARTLEVLKVLAAEMKNPDGDIKVYLQDTDLVLVDRSSDFTYDTTDAENVCWITQGLVEEAVAWANNQDFEVRETACCAHGNEMCEFKIAL